MLDKLHEINASSDWRIVGPKIKSRECDIYQACSSCGTLLAVKHYSRQTEQAAANQHSALQKYYPAMNKNTADLLVPKVYFFHKESRILLMEWISGRSLHSHLWRPLTSPQQRRTYLAKTGAWLRAFHNASTMVSCQTSGNDLQESVDKQKAKSTNDQLVNNSNRLYSHAYARIQKFSKESEQFTVQQAHPHGDFTPANLLLSNNLTFGVDIWNHALRPIDIDMARMTVYLTIAYPLLNRHPLFDHKKKLQPNLLPLFDGYGTDVLDPHSTYFKMALLTEYLRRWMVIKQRTVFWKKISSDRYQERQIEKQIKSLLAILS
jgi:hypothetical protein